ncbi:MAG TPA: DUF6455 family protein [Azospirillum sp.]|nr:DUF6455 family protein [Azospirillum sp.]
MNLVEQRALNMPRMMRRLGVDIEAAYGTGLGLVMARAARRCSLCRTVETCTGWLARPSADDAHRDFCPNAELFERMAG